MPKLVNCRSFSGMINFLSAFLEDLRKYLIPIYEAQKKKYKFDWMRECQTAFESIKGLLITLPVLYTLIAVDRFRLESDISRTTSDRALFYFK